MREIKFRGKRLDNGEWVVGSLFNSIWRKSADGSRVCYIFPDNMLDDNGGGDCWEDFAEVAEQYEVDPATVGQFTGLKDKNGRDIYEGDILKSERDDRLYVVKFWSGMFYASVKECNKGIFGGFPLHALTENEESGYECDIIGNIHDNPELLKTE